jgi:hypothetical protein
MQTNLLACPDWIVALNELPPEDCTVTAPVLPFWIWNAQPRARVVTSGNWIIWVVEPDTYMFCGEELVRAVVPAADVMFRKPVRLFIASGDAVAPVPPFATGIVLTARDPAERLRPVPTEISSAAPVPAVVLPRILLVAIVRLCSAFQFEGWTSEVSPLSAIAEVNACLSEIAI